MASLKELLAQHKAKENAATKGFLEEVAALEKAITDGKVTSTTRRITLDGNRYSFALLGENLSISGKSETLNALREFKSAAQNADDAETQTLIGKFYPKQKRPRAKKDRTPATPQS